MKDKKTGETLLRTGLINEQQYVQILEKQIELKCQKSFDEIALDFGFINRIQLVQVLSAKYELPFSDPNEYNVNINAVMKIPEKIARKYMVIAVDILDDKLVIVTDNPEKTGVFEDIEAFTGMKTQMILTERTLLLNAINKYYSGGGNS